MAWNSVNIDVNKSINASSWLKANSLEYGTIYDSGLIPDISAYDVMDYQIREKIDGEYTGKMVNAISRKFQRYIFRCLLFAAFNDDSGAKLSKRINKAYQNMKNDNLASYYSDGDPVTDDDVKEFAGKCAEVYGKLTENKPIVFEFYTGKVDWIAGSFGNPSSCWLGGGSYGIAKNMIESAMQADKAFTVRFYSNRGSGIVQCPDERYTGYSGYGRLWGVMIDDNPVLFNAYPSHSDGDRYLQSICKMIGKEFTKIYLCDDGGDMYINNGMGYLIHNPGEFNADYENVSMEFPDYDDNTYVTCAICGDHEDEDSAYFVEDRGYVCEYCFNNHYFYCNRCGETFNQSELCDCNGNDYCETCASIKGYVLCDDCQEYTRDYHVTVDGQTLCDNCAETQGYKYCDVCGECHNDNVMVDREEINTCETCASTRYDVCADCHGYTDNPLETHTGYICETCASTRGYDLCETCNKYCIGTIDNTCPYCKE